MLETFYERLSGNLPTSTQQAAEKKEKPPLGLRPTVVLIPTSHQSPQVEAVGLKNP
jgi:hypothetical protein